ncbi:hypothetical protein OG976_19890 [Mycobacterium sp. NBC_00419]|uniref:hypothetical protein n=1 Tax=Mycobacterium sp. NBC_00419 TaxID=2975989 RepID=UPI002E217CBC
MTVEEPVSYFALLDDAGRPVGLLRRTHGQPLPRDESLRRDFSWRPSEFLRKYELGHNDYDYKEISARDAEVLIARWRIKWAESGE